MVEEEVIQDEPLRVKKKWKKKDYKHIPVRPATFKKFREVRDKHTNFTADRNSGGDNAFVLFLIDLFLKDINKFMVKG